MVVDDLRPNSIKLLRLELLTLSKVVHDVGGMQEGTQGHHVSESHDR